MNDSKRILVAEDDQITRKAWTELLTSWGFQVEETEDGQAALDALERRQPHILLLDLKLPRKDGLTVLSELKHRGVQLPTVVISGADDIDDAVHSIKFGAYDYLRKPVEPHRLKRLLHNLCEHLAVSDENRFLRKRLMQAGELGPMVGQSPQMKKVMALTEQVAPSASSVVILGESGTGKELVARTIHELSPRRKGPYLAINCAAFPETLMESELFGHERGAFTGAERRREGCFELANGGTLLLDEITEMKVELQAKLLRVLEEQKLRRVGGTVDIPLDVRVLAASNRSLQSAMKENKLREDLYYRLNVFTIELPPLRKRPSDIPALIEHFIHGFAQADGKTVTGADNQCIEVLKSYEWPGNVRQLRNVIERAVVVAKEPLLSVADLPPEITGQAASATRVELRVGCSLDEFERELILKTLDSVSGNKQRAAEILGISLKTLYNRLERYRGSESTAVN
jgi:two-component system, NtrC family, response regulator HydG